MTKAVEKIGWIEANAITKAGIEELCVKDRIAVAKVKKSKIRANSFAIRKKSITRHMQNMKPLIYDAIAKKDFSEFRVAYFGPYKNNDPKTQKGMPYIICLKALRIEHRKVNGKNIFQTTADGIVGLILPHAITRFIQRTGERDFTKAMETVAGGLNWFSFCNSMSHRGSVFAPSEQGLLCGAVENVAGYVRPVVKTFISTDELNAENLDRWSRLQTIGSMHGSPRIVARNGWKQWHIDALQIMIDEGQSRDLKNGIQPTSQNETKKFILIDSLPADLKRDMLQLAE